MSPSEWSPNRCKHIKCYVSHTLPQTVKHTNNFCFVLQQLKKATVVSDQFFDLPLSAKKKYARGGSYGYVESEQELWVTINAVKQSSFCVDSSLYYTSARYVILFHLDYLRDCLFCVDSTYTIYNIIEGGPEKSEPHLFYSYAVNKSKYARQQ